MVLVSLISPGLQAPLCTGSPQAAWPNGSMGGRPGENPLMLLSRLDD